MNPPLHNKSTSSCQYFYSYYVVYHSNVLALRWKSWRSWPVASHGETGHALCPILTENSFTWPIPFHHPPKKWMIRHQSRPPLSQPLCRNRPFLASQLWWGEHFIRRSLPQSRNQPFTGPEAQCTSVQPESQRSWTRRHHIRSSTGSRLHLNCTYCACSHYKVDSSYVSSLECPPCGNLSLFACLMPVQVT